MMTGIVLLISIIVLWYLSRRWIRSGYVYLLCLLAMSIPWLMNCKSALQPWIGNASPTFLFLLLFALLISLDFIPWIITDAAFPVFSRKLRVKPSAVPAMRVSLAILAGISIFSLLLLIPKDIDAISQGTDFYRSHLHSNTAGESNLLSKISTVGAFLFIFDILGFFISLMDKKLYRLAPLLLIGSLAYPANTLMFFGREAQIIFPLVFVSIGLLLLPMYSSKIRKCLVGAAVGIIVFGGFSGWLLTKERFKTYEDGFNFNAVTAGYFAQQPYMFSKTLEEEKDFFGFNICFPLLAETTGFKGRPLSEANWQYERCFPTQHGNFFMIGGWWSLVLFSILYTGGFSTATYYLRKKHRYLALLMLFSIYLFLQLTGLFYFKAGATIGTNIFFLLITIISFFAPDFLEKIPNTKPKPRLLQLTTTIEQGSIGNITLQLAESAASNGWEAAITYGRTYSSKSNKSTHNIKIWKTGDFFSTSSHFLLSRIFDRHGLGSKSATKELCRRIEEFEPDVVHIHNIHGYWLNYPTLFKFLKKHDYPVVWTMHDCWALTGHCAHFLPQNCNKYLEKCQNCKARSAYPSSLICNSEKNLLRKNESFKNLENLNIVCVSNWLKTVFKNSHFSKYPIHVIHNNIDHNVFSPHRANGNLLPDKLKRIPEDKKIILAVASKWTPEKGVEALAKIAGKLPEGWEMAIVGDVPKPYIADLTKNNIAILGRINDPGILASCYQRADLFINPTLADSFPTVNLEAKACQLPIVSTNCGGTPETIDSRRDICVSPGEEFIKAVISQVMEINKETKIKKSNNHIDITSKNNVNFTNLYLKLYNTLLKA